MAARKKPRTARPAASKKTAPRTKPAPARAPLAEKAPDQRPKAGKATKNDKKRDKKKDKKRKKVKSIPKGYHAVTAYLCVDGAADAIDFYKRAFGAEERLRMEAPQGRVGHAELVIGDSAVMLADESPEMKFTGPIKGEGTPVNIHLYVKDVDKIVARAVAAGATVLREIEDKFYGDRMGSIEDPFGHVWHIATHVEDVGRKEMKRRSRKRSS